MCVCGALFQFFVNFIFLVLTESIFLTQHKKRRTQKMSTTTTTTTRQRKRKVIIDTDCGGDDAVGILVAAADPNVEIVMLSAVWGNCSVEQGTENLGKLVDVIGRDIPIYMGAAGPTLGQPRETVQWYGFGEDAFGDAGFKPSQRAVEGKKNGKHASLALLETLNSIKENDDDEDDDSCVW